MEILHTVTPFNFDLLFDSIGIIIGVISILIVFSSTGSVGGNAGKALQLFLWGTSVMIGAFLWTVMIELFSIQSSGLHDIHHGLMFIGMILFVFSMRKFSSVLNI